MSKPSTTYFCARGHLLEDNPPGVMGEYDLLEDGEYSPCPFCQSTDVVSTLDWHEGSVIPILPIRRDDIKLTDHRGQTYYQLISVFDVSAKLRPS